MLESRPGEQTAIMHSHARGKPSTVMRVERGAGPGNFEPLATEESMRKGQIFLRSKEAHKVFRYLR